MGFALFPARNAIEKFPEAIDADNQDDAALVARVWLGHHGWGMRIDRFLKEWLSRSFEGSQLKALVPMIGLFRS